MAPCNWPGRDGNKLVWGPPRDVEESIAVLRQAVASGVNVATITGDRGADIGTPIEQAYPAFNKRDIDGALALMTDDVSLAQSFGGRQSDREERDPRLLDSTMGRVRSPCRPLAITEEDGGKVRVRVHQIVKDLQGNVLSDSEVLDVFTMNTGLIAAMHIGDEVDATDDPSAAFAHRS
jgi:hypothetical protein